MIMHNVFYRGVWQGRYTIKEIVEIKKEFQKRAKEFMEATDYPHVIYSYYSFTDKEDDREYFFDILGTTEEEFDKVGKLKGLFIYALHRH